MVSLSTFLYLWFRVNEEIEQEKQRISLLKGVEGFDLSQLKHTETEEKIVLPSKEGQSGLRFVFRWSVQAFNNARFSNKNAEIMLSNLASLSNTIVNVNLVPFSTLMNKLESLMHFYALIMKLINVFVVVVWILMNLSFRVSYMCFISSYILICLFVFFSQMSRQRRTNKTCLLESKVLTQLNWSMLKH